uniref:MgtC/SapB/SrpB/YhiD N-terminal domain-containing protein n=1 Tax=Rhodosorus marinus TaxID=101924 RepID=A0A7S3EEB2_9RHOD|mmetsp:Transcript_25691/g.101302  ORF Transcript_25691/g.101302 Transcript_25691/m.101302 type:complete len:292 (+) Transcript_25691:47-922(+)
MRVTEILEGVKRWWRWYLDRYFPPKRYQSLNGALYLLIALFVAAFSVVNVFAEVLVRDCDYIPDPYASSWDNKLYPSAECYYEKRWFLLGLSLWEADKGQRLILSIVLGAVLGYERRSPDRPAGMRLMSLVSLGACCFTISSMFCFESSSSSFDTARVSAAIVSGVGFLGSAMIWKEANRGGSQENLVHGLTTAASVWVAASLGIASGGRLYFTGIYTTILVVLLLRFGPRSPEKGEDSEIDEEPGVVLLKRSAPELSGVIPNLGESSESSLSTNTGLVKKKDRRQQVFRF